MATAGAQRRVAAERMRHSGMSLTTRIYTRLGNWPAVKKGPMHNAMEINRVVLSDRAGSHEVVTNKVGARGGS